MYAFEYDFFPKPEHGANEAFINGIKDFLVALRNNGQLLNSLDNIVEYPDCVRVQCVGPAADALDPEHHNDYCKNDLSKLLAASSKPPEFRTAGKVAHEDGCACGEPSSYILYTTYTANLPPVRCGDCSLSVPLYRLPFFQNEKEYWTLLNWERTYQICNRLWIDSCVGERLGYQQMSNVNSDLTRRGREICAEMAARIGKPFYYFLKKYYETRRKTCPGCGRPWKLAQGWHNFFAFKCDHCFLLSNEPNGEPTPLRDLHP